MEEDVVVNTFHFNVAGIDDNFSRWESIVSNLAGFYAGQTGSIVPLTNWMSALINESAAAHKVRIYRLSDPVPRAPIHEGAFSLAPSGSPLPSEVALCLSYRGALFSGSNPARRRGRIYLGPLSTVAASSGIGGRDVVPVPNLMTSLLNAGKRLTDANIGYGVYSKTDGLFTPITTFWVDNSFDTQRRRGSKPTARQTLAA
jgi:hypothetical protein